MRGLNGTPQRTLIVVAGLNAYAKGVSLGLLEPSSKAVDEPLMKAKDGDTPKVAQRIGRSRPA